MGQSICTMGLRNHNNNAYREETIGTTAIISSHKSTVHRVVYILHTVLITHTMSIKLAVFI